MMNNNKRVFETPILEILKLEAADIITVSGEPNSIEQNDPISTPGLPV